MRNPFRTFIKMPFGPDRYSKTRLRRDCALFLAPTALATTMLAAVTQNAEVLAAAWRDPAVVLDERSPGDRDPDALYTTKSERILAQILPAERVLPVVRERLGPGGAPLPGDAGFPGLALNERVLPGIRERFGPDGLPLTDDLPLIQDFVFDQPELMPFAPMPGNGSLPLPPSPTPPGSGFNPIPAAPPPELSSPVPEPSTWMISIIGLFAVAATMRRRNRRMLYPALPAGA